MWKLSIALTLMLSPGSVLAEAPETVTWAEVMGRCIVLQARRTLPDAEVRLRTDNDPAGGWNLDEGSAATTITFAVRGSRKTAVSYVISPWQSLWWHGAGAPEPRVVTVNRYAVVLGPIPGTATGEGPDRLRAKALAMVRGQVGAVTCELGWRADPQPARTPREREPIEKGTLFRPYYVRMERPTPADSTASLGTRGDPRWAGALQRRMLLVIRRKNDPKAPGTVLRHEWYAPTDVDRSRPRPPDPTEQHPAPEVDLEAERRRMHQGILHLFAGAVTRALAGDERKTIVSESQPKLKEAIVSYAGHTGPATAAGEAALQRWKERLHDLVVDETFWPPPRDYWPSTLTAYRPELIEKLWQLPMATAPTKDLLRAFRRLAELAEKHRGTPSAEAGGTPSDEELLLAELGDRLRTAVATTGPTASTPGGKTLNFDAYTFVVTHPLRSTRTRAARGPVRISIVVP